MKIAPKDIEDLVSSIVGKDALQVMRLIKNKKNVSEFKIAEKMKLNINQVRNMLYRMNEHSLVSFTRKKDKKKGWYIYYWTFNEKQAKNLYTFLKRKKLDDLKARLKESQEETFYVCRSDFINFSLLEALDNNFTCPECGKVLKEEKVVRNFDKIRKDILAIEQELSDSKSKVPKKAK